MRRTLPFSAALLAGAFLTGPVAEASAWYSYPAPASWVTWDDYGYLAPAPCERIPARRTYWAAGYDCATGAPTAPAATWCADVVPYPPLRPAAGFDPYDRSPEFNRSW